jgi:hypothetical protein
MIRECCYSNDPPPLTDAEYNRQLAEIEGDAW